LSWQSKTPLTAAKLTLRWTIDTTTKRIGFCCKWIDHSNQVNGIKPTDAAKKYNTGSTTVAWLGRQPRSVAEEKLWDLMKSNIESTRLLVEKVGTLDEHLRMVRISSDLLPVYTHRDWDYFWRQPDVRLYAERAFAAVGLLARERGVRLSFHPGQFTVLASDSPDIVRRSIEEFEYHADMARWMGYGQKFQDFKINVHISGRQGPDGIRKVLGLLSPEARNCITIENEENAWGLDDCLSISDVVPIVLDIHHHWVREGEYISPGEDRVLRVIDSWRGTRPALHYSVSRESWLTGHDPNTLPDYQLLLARGHKKQKLRAHSDFYWNRAVTEWALSFWDNFDIQCESKGKNLASFEVYRQALKL
jgi:UV DNA damage repair endonuclease